MAGLIGAYRLGNVGLANGIGVGVADNKAVYHFVPEIIRYYLARSRCWPTSPPTWPAIPANRAYILEHLDELVVKAVDQSGGYGMLIGPHATQAEREEFAARIAAHAGRIYRAANDRPLARIRPSWAIISRGATSTCGPFVALWQGDQRLPGGFTRVALRPGSLVVNSSQGGGSKDTWVLEGGGVIARC